MKIWIAFNGVYNNYREFRDVASWAEAQRVWNELRDEECIGASDMMSRCGDVFTNEGSHMGHISYNGRAWNLDGSEVAA